MSETYKPYPGAPEFSARPNVMTRRGTEVHSHQGDRLVNAANRVASFMDRVIGRRTEIIETAQDKLGQGKQFLAATGEKAVGIATATGKVVGGAALIGLEIGVGAAVIGGEKAVKGAKAAKEAAGNGLDKANAWLETKADQVNDAIDSGIDKAIDFGQNTLNTVKLKGAEAKEAVTGRYEAVRGFFHDRAETAKLKMDKMRRNWVAGYSRTRRGARNTFESGKAFAAETGENIKHNGRALRKAGQLAIAQYRADAVPVMPR